MLNGIIDHLRRQTTAERENARLLALNERLNATVARLAERRDVLVAQVDALAEANGILTSRLERYEPVDILTMAPGAP